MFDWLKSKLRKNRGLKYGMGYSVMEIAQATGLLPSEVEGVLRKLQEQGAVKIVFYADKVYAYTVGSKDSLDELIRKMNQPGRDSAYR